MPEHDEDMNRIERLLERSSLGSAAAQQLRRRTPAADVEAARRIYQLRSRMVHAGGDDAIAAATELVDFLTELGYHGQADHVLHEWFPQEGQTIADMATSTLLFRPRRGTRPARKSSAPAGRQPQLPLDDLPAQDGPRIATLTLAPANDWLPDDDPHWQAELHTLFVDLREQVGALPIARGASRGTPRPHEPYVLILVFQYTSQSVTDLSVCLGNWLNSHPGRTLDVAIDAKRWSQRLVLRAGGAWSLADPAEQTNDGG